MAEDFRVVRRDITQFLASLRQMIDRPFRDSAPVADGERERFLRGIMMVEEARIRFNTYMRYREQPTRAEWAMACKELVSFVNEIAHSNFIEPKVYDRRFRVMPMSIRDRDHSSQFMQALIDRERPVTVAEALIMFRAYLERSDIRVAAEQRALSFGDLERIVPRQQVAPVQFDIVDDRIVVSKRTPTTAEADRANIQSALEHIRGSGDQLISNLENSNCDKRLLDKVKELQLQLVSDGNVVKIGLTNMACGVMSAQFQTELPGAIAGMLNSYNASISLYVAQFPEWDQFTQRAAAIDLDEDDVVEVDVAAGDVIDALEQDPSLADAEVPKTIAFVRRFLSFPGASSKRAAFAVIRTIENLVSSIIRHSMKFLSNTAEKLVDAGSTATSKVIIGLLGIALVSASGIGPAAVRAGVPWVKQAAEIVLKQIERTAE